MTKKKKVRTKVKQRQKQSQSINIVIDQSRRTTPRNPSAKPLISRTPIVLPPQAQPQQQFYSEFQTAKLIDNMSGIETKIKDTLAKSLLEMNTSTNTYINDAFNTGASRIQTIMNNRFNEFGNHIDNEIERLREETQKQKQKPVPIKKVKISEPMLAQGQIPSIDTLFQSPQLSTINNPMFETSSIIQGENSSFETPAIPIVLEDERQFDIEVPVKPRRGPPRKVKKP